ncbi:MAG TPA: type II toxin-antitoxin system prevent-host-death family antitoxin [Candidatus Latescibacteria bacterium]|jgi:antitoxin (DNA-binding transcriptional repressor) of toxin-antitoxin stability system|nr:type II toxin-antitoxin system prevent-host-death family antitoxin [Gemmatimonadaceae bacterium]MDP6015233.1 type II toxin-antitoxin system prevent-host-death family antitoxin [Candidatus Latescibacterota bacterium]HJP30471.1 type II toxin-antitoxin system prevent-host-death family antitoxin [Candidatus Latescibacterota bacterium]|tara:strand:+ start:32 stop:268 length:237 start_codon:yes stop_codon:yes gene_type:complete
MPTHQVNIHEAKTHLSRLIQEALEGTEVIIAKGNRPVARLEILPEGKPERRIGGSAGLVIRMDEDFDASLDDFASYSE